MALDRVRLNYVELPIVDLARSRDFFTQAFGWALSAFGPDYAATTTDDVDLGLDSSVAAAPPIPLPIIEVADLEATLDRVGQAGGVITKPIFSFPGGRRFHFQEPSGNELAVWCRTDTEA